MFVAAQALLIRDGCLNFIDENDEVLISGFGRRGHAVDSSDLMQEFLVL